MAENNVFKNFNSVLGLASGIATLYGTSFAVAIWMLQVWPPQPTMYYWILLLGCTLCVPTMLVLGVGWWSSTSNECITVAQLVSHFLDHCFQEMALITIEFRKEKGKQFSKSRRAAAVVLDHYYTSFRTRFERDKELLRRILNQKGSVARDKFVDFKKKILINMDKALALLSQDADNEKSRTLIAEAAQLIDECLAKLDSVRDEIVQTGSIVSD